MVPRLLRIDGPSDLTVIGALIKAGPLDSSLRGWAGVLPPFDAATSALIRDAALGKLSLVQGATGAALIGDLPELRWLGLGLASSLHPNTARTGATLREWTEGVLNPPPPQRWRKRTVDWTRPVVMGVVNVTPDSFSDGGQLTDVAAAVQHGLRLVAEGADVLDVGGESTRPRGKAYGAGAQTVPAEEELARVLPVVRGLRTASDVPISIDTRKAAVAKACLQAGADIVNDVTGLQHDPDLASVVREAGALLVLVHTPRDIEDLSHEEASTDILGDVIVGLQAALARAAGIDQHRILLDPGIGFGKSAAHNLYLLRHLEGLRALGHPMVVGASRKASIARAAAGDSAVPAPGERLGASVGAAVLAYLHGAHVLRVHDVRETVQALRVAAAIRGATDAGTMLMAPR